MSKSYRGIYFAIGLVVGVSIALLFFVWSFPWFSHPPNEMISDEAQRTEYSDKQHRGPNEGYWLPEFSVRDTYAQWLMTLLAFTATIFSIIAVKWAKSAARSSEAQVRAYLSCPGGNISINDKDRLVIELELKNFGHSPARDVFVWADADIYDGSGNSFETTAESVDAVTISANGGFVFSLEFFAGFISFSEFRKGNYKLDLWFHVKSTDVFGTVHRDIFMKENFTSTDRLSNCTHIESQGEFEQERRHHEPPF